MPHDTTAHAPAPRVLVPDADARDEARGSGTQQAAAVAPRAERSITPGDGESRSGGSPVPFADRSPDTSLRAAKGSGLPRAGATGAAPAREGGTPAEPNRPAADKQALADQRQAAREAWLAEPALTGAALAARFGRKPRWGREQIAAARREAQAAQTAGAPPATNAPRTNGRAAPPATNGTSSRDGAAARAGAGTAATPSGMPGPGNHAGAAHGGAPRAAARATSQAPDPGSRADRRDEEATPPALLGVTVVSVALVTVVCAVVSYSHARHLAELAGQGGLAPWLPLAVDGLVAAATCSLLVDRRRGERGHGLAWLGAGLGLAGSFGANLVAVDPTLVDLRHVRWVLAGYVPAALAISGHLLMRMLGDHARTTRPNHDGR